MTPRTGWALLAGVVTLSAWVLRRPPQRWDRPHPHRPRTPLADELRRAEGRIPEDPETEYDHTWREAA